MPVERERLAYICNHKSHGELPQRVFLLPGDAVPPRCSDGHPMVRQINVPYLRVADDLESLLHDARRVAGETGAMWHPFTVRLAECIVALRDVAACPNRTEQRPVIE